MLYRVLVSILYPFFMLLYRIKVIGLNNIPQGAAVLCANHTTMLDPVLIAVGITPKHKLTFMAKKEIFKNKLIGAFFRAVGAFPVDRDAADLATIRTSLSILKSGGKLLLFPEGHRMKNGHMEADEVKTGVAMIAMRANVPIVPIYLSSVQKIFHKTIVSIGEPIYPEKREGSNSDNYRRIATEAFEAICAMEDAEKCVK